jgi:hypothetical protein
MDKMWFSDVADVKDPSRDELQGFVTATMAFLSFVMEQPEFGFLWESDRDLHELAFETFKIDVQRSADHLLHVIPEISPNALDIHGLLGRPARFKLRVVDSLGRKWDQFRDQFRVREWFRKIVEAIDAVLDSLIAAAGGVGGVIKEFKDALLALG